MRIPRPSTALPSPSPPPAAPRRRSPASAHVTIPEPGEQGGFSIVTLQRAQRARRRQHGHRRGAAPPGPPARLRVRAAQAGLDGRHDDPHPRRARRGLRRGDHRGRRHRDVDGRHHRPRPVRHVLAVGRPAARRRRRSSSSRRSRPTRAARRSPGSRTRPASGEEPERPTPILALVAARAATTTVATADEADDRRPTRPPPAPTPQATTRTRGPTGLAVAALVVGVLAGAARRRRAIYRSPPTA